MSMSRNKEKMSPDKTSQHEDIYLNDLQVEIKQEDELIIEDADQHVQWSFIGLDDDDDASDEVVDWKAEQTQVEVFKHQNVSGLPVNHYKNTSFDEVIEISDEEDYMYENAPILDSDTSAIFITNEPLHDSIIETYKNHNATSPTKDAANETASPCLNNDVTDSNNETTQKANDVGNISDFVQQNADCEIKTTFLALNNNNLIDNVDNFNVGTFNKWIKHKFIKISCHICGTSFQHSCYAYWAHLKGAHAIVWREIATKYKLLSDTVGVCKLCKVQVTPKINHTFHYMTNHMEPRPEIFVCCFCDYKNSSVANLQNHQLENHPTVLSKHEQCPKCDEAFKDISALEYHFMSEHLREFNSKYIYKCHICGDQFENSKNRIFAHLTDKHKLSNWKALNFRKIENGTIFSCIKCHKIIIKSNVNNLLSHYLTHEEKSYWSCKYCTSKIRFKDWPLSHFCRPMRNYFEEKNKSTNDDKTNLERNQPNEEKAVSWDEFELYIEHICPFCNRGFLKFEEWRCHVRESHYIHTLEGLNMEVLPEQNKLKCLQCDAHVEKSALELHKHRFEHLPFKPYKCRHCVESLETYKKAITHVQKNCQDSGDKCGNLHTDGQTTISRNDSTTPSQETASDGVIILCPLCNNKRFSNIPQISKHITNVHNNFDKFFSKPSKDGSRSCKICGSNIKQSKWRNVTTHFLLHLNERPFKCQKCSRSYPLYKLASEHVQMYHLDTNTNGDQLFGHVKEKSECVLSPIPKHEPKTSSNLGLSPIPALNSILPPTPNLKLSPTPNCSTPPIMLMQPPPLEHTHKSSTALKEDTKEKLYIADFNNPVFKTYEQYIKFACPECNEPFMSATKFETHIKSQHSFYWDNGLCFIAAQSKRYKRVKCLDCHAILPAGNSKQQLHKLTHMPFRTFICTFCLSRFTAISHLYSHFKKSHFQEGNFKCDLCPKILATDFDRLQHIKQDHPREIWPINMCTTCLKIVNDFEEHLQSNHLQHIRKYRCEICRVYYEFERELDVHMVKIHSKPIERAVNETSPSEGKRKLRSLSSDDNAKKSRPSTDSKNAKQTCSTPLSPLKSRRLK